MAAGILLVAIGIGWYLLPLGDWVGGLRGWILDLGFAGIAIFVAIYIIATVLLAPASLLTIAAGFAYGFWALPIVLVAATTGASIAFLTARHIARDRVRRLVESRRNIVAVDKAIEAEGWKIVLLLRLSVGVPFGLQNYVLGVTAVSFSRFVAATFAGIIPGTAIYVYLGALGEMAGKIGPLTWSFFGAGLLASVLLIILIMRKAAVHLREAGLGPPAS